MLILKLQRTVAMKITFNTVVAVLIHETIGFTFEHATVRNKWPFAVLKKHHDNCKKTLVFDDSLSLKMRRSNSIDYLYKFCIHFAVCLSQVDKQIGIYNDNYTMGIFDIELRGLWSLKRL